MVGATKGSVVLNVTLIQTFKYFFKIFYKYVLFIGVKVVSARKGSVILNVQLAYKPTISSTKAFEVFTESIQGPIQSTRIQQLIGEILNLRTEKVYMTSYLRKTMDYLIGQNFGGQNCPKSDLLPKVLSATKFCPPKSFVRRKFCPMKSKTCLINTNLMFKHIFLVNCMGK